MTGKEIAERIEYFIEKQHTSKYALAKKCGLPSSSINNIFVRHGYPSIRIIEKIVTDGFEITMGEFYGEKAESSISEDDLSDIEQHVIYAYRSLSEYNKQTAVVMLDALCKKKNKEE